MTVSSLESGALTPVAVDGTVEVVRSINRGWKISAGGGRGLGIAGETAGPSVGIAD